MPNSAEWNRDWRQTLRTMAWLRRPDSLTAICAVVGLPLSPQSSLASWQAPGVTLRQCPRPVNQARRAVDRGNLRKGEGSISHAFEAR